MSWSNGRVLLSAFLCVWLYVPCCGQVELSPAVTTKIPHAKPEPVVSKIHDLSSAINAHIQLSKQPESKATEEALMVLFLGAEEQSAKRKEVRPGVFEVVAPESYHEHLSGLAKWMTDGEKQITIESRFITVSEEGLRKLHAQCGAAWEMTTAESGPQDATQLPTLSTIPGPDFRSNRTGPAPVVAASSVSNKKQLLPCRIASIRKSQLDRIIQEAQADTRTNILQAPKVTIFDGQEAVVSDVTSRPFVTSVKPIEGKAGAAMEPVVSVLDDGLTMRIKASAVGDHEVQMDSDVTFGEIGNVDTFTFETPGKFNGMSVQIPEYTERKISISKTLANDRFLVIDPHFFKEKVTKRRFRSDITTREYTILILTARVIRQEEEQEEPKVAKL